MTLIYHTFGIKDNSILHLHHKNEKVAIKIQLCTKILVQYLIRQYLAITSRIFFDINNLDTKIKIVPRVENIDIGMISTTDNKAINKIKHHCKIVFEKSTEKSTVLKRTNMILCYLHFGAEQKCMSHTFCVFAISAAINSSK